jgi:uncharacterized membrane protein SpoIIM required for sporulation
MKQRTFESQNEERWQAFGSLVVSLDTIGRGRPLASQRVTLADFPARYLEVCRDLAIATERGYSPKLTDRLNRLALDGHRVLYTRDPNFAPRIARFVAVDFPRKLREEWRLMAASAILFLVPGLVVWGLVGQFPELVYSVMDGVEVRNFEAMYDPAGEHIGTDRESADDVGMFGFYIFNNIGIAFRAFAGGLFLGVGSAIILAMNGILLGAVAAHVTHLGFEETFFSFVIGHGAFELTAIVISGAAGLKLGWSIAAPGARARLVSLREAASESVSLIYGVFGMLVIAALLEAFWSSKASVASELKFAVGAVLWAMVLIYFLGAGRTISGTGRSLERTDRAPRNERAERSEAAPRTANGGAEAIHGS